jgi:hypothetical protein
MALNGWQSWFVADGGRLGKPKEATGMRDN